MKQYPSIPHLSMIDATTTFYVFDKIDGSNIRAEWSKKKGFHKFGSRKVLLSAESNLALAKTLIEEQTDEISKVLTSLRIQDAILFFEYYGDNSFAGFHEEGNADNKRVYLLDVDVYKQGFLHPKDFVSSFQNILTPTLLAHQPLTEELLRSVRQSTLEGMTREGIVAKAFAGRQKPHTMAKYKSQEWLDSVKIKYGENADAL